MKRSVAVWILSACVEADASNGGALCQKLEDDAASTCARHPDWCTVVGCVEIPQGSNYGLCPRTAALVDAGALRRAGRACERAGGLWVGPDDEYWESWEEHATCDFGDEWEAAVACNTLTPPLANE
jgi:hypothetical protein